MNMHTTRGRTLRLLVIILTLVGAIAVVAHERRAAPETGAASASLIVQDVIGLDRRMSQLEQRFNSVEATLRNLEQQSTLQSNIPRGVDNTRETEITLLRTQVEMLQRRLIEVECGLVKVDERTLPERVRTQRQTSAAVTIDQCRKDANSPLQLSTRP